MGTGDPLTRAERRAYQLGRRRFELDDAEEALTHFQELLRTHEGFADVHYMMGVLHDRRDETDAAAEELREALRINPRYAEAMLALANVYGRSGDFELSEELALRASATSGPPTGDIDPITRGKLANLQKKVGDAHREAGDLRGAIESYRGALDHCPGYSDIRRRLGIALREAGLPNRALIEFGRILSDRPHDLDAANQRAITLYSLGRAEEARAVWSAIVMRDPARRDAQMYLRLVGPGAG